LTFQLFIAILNFVKYISYYSPN